MQQYLIDDGNQEAMTLLTKFKFFVIPDFSCTIIVQGSNHFPFTKLFIIIVELLHDDVNMK